MIYSDVISYCDTNGEYLAALRKLIKEKKYAVVPFIGSGLSVFAGYEDWDGLLNKAASECLPQEYIDEYKKLKPAQKKASFIEEKSNGQFRPFLSKEFSKERLNSVTGRKWSSSVTLLPILFKDLVITTNYEEVLEMAYTRYGSSFASILLPTSSNVTSEIRNRNHSLFKIHGDVNNINNAIISENDYNKYYGEGSTLPLALRNCFITNVMLFMGTSLKLDSDGIWVENSMSLWTNLLSDYNEDDEFVNYALIAWDKNAKWNEKEKTGFKSKQELVEAYKKHKIRAILFDPADDFIALRIILEHLCFGDTLLTNSWGKLDARLANGGEWYKRMVFYGEPGYFPTSLSYEKDDGTEGRIEDSTKVIDYLIGQPNPRMLVSSEGGMGKTTMCANIWKHCLDHEKLLFYIPLSAYNIEAEVDLRSYVLKNYFSESASIKDLEELLKSQYKKPIFILDGHNEMFNMLELAVMTAFGQELQWISDYRCPIIITSRISEDTLFELFVEAEINKLEKKEITQILNNRKIDISEIGGQVYELLSNRMFLSMYITRQEYKLPSHLASKQLGIASGFFEDPTTRGEIIWDGITADILRECQVSMEDIGKKFDLVSAFKLYIQLRHIIPYAIFCAYTQRTDDSIRNVFRKNWMKEEDFNKFLIDFCEKYTIDYQNNIPELMNLHRRLPFDKSFVELTAIDDNIFANTALLTKTVNSTGIKFAQYSTSHDYIWDAMIAQHIRNQILAGEKNVSVTLTPDVLSCDFNDDVLGMLADILQEHKLEKKGSPLRKYMSHYNMETSDKEENILQTAAYNFISILRNAHKNEIDGETFTGLDLRKCGDAGNMITNSLFNGCYINSPFFIQPKRLSSIDRIRFFTIKGRRYIVSSSLIGDLTIWDCNTGEIKYHNGDVFKENPYYSLSVDTTRLEVSDCGKYIYTAPLGMIWKVSLENGNINLVEAKERDEDDVDYEKFINKPSHPDYHNAGLQIDRDGYSGEQSHYYESRILSKEAGYGRVQIRAYTSDGRYIFACIDNKIIIYDVKSDDFLETIELKRSQSYEYVRSIDCASDNRHIIVGTEYDVYLYDFKYKKLIRSYQNNAKFECGDLSDNGLFFATGNLNGVIKIWDISKNEIARVYSAFHEKERITAIKYSNDSKYIYFGTDSGKVLKLDVNSSEFVIVHEGHSSPVDYIHVTETDVLSASRFSEIVVWDIHDGKNIKKTINMQPEIWLPGRFFCFSNCGNFCAFEYGAWFNPEKHTPIKIYNLVADKWIDVERERSDGLYMDRVAFSPDNSCIAVYSAEKVKIIEFDETSFSLKSTREIPIDTEVSISSEHYEGDTSDIRKLMEAFNNVCFSKDGSKLITATAEGFVTIYDTKTLAKQTSIAAKTFHKYKFINYTSDNSKIVACGEDNIFIWNIINDSLQAIIFNVCSNIMGNKIQKLLSDDLFDGLLVMLRQNGVEIGEGCFNNETNLSKMKPSNNSYILHILNIGIAWLKYGRNYVTTHKEFKRAMRILEKMTLLENSAYCVNTSLASTYAVTLCDALYAHDKPLKYHKKNDLDAKDKELDFSIFVQSIDDQTNKLLDKLWDLAQKYPAMDRSDPNSNLPFTYAMTLYNLTTRSKPSDQYSQLVERVDNLRDKFSNVEEVMDAASFALRNIAGAQIGEINKVNDVVCRIKKIYDSKPVDNYKISIEYIIALSNKILDQSREDDIETLDEIYRVYINQPFIDELVETYIQILQHVYKNNKSLSVRNYITNEFKALHEHFPDNKEVFKHFLMMYSECLGAIKRRKLPFTHPKTAIKLRLKGDTYSQRALENKNRKRSWSDIFNNYPELKELKWYFEKYLKVFTDSTDLNEFISDFEESLNHFFWEDL